MQPNPLEISAGELPRSVKSVTKDNLSGAAAALRDDGVVIVRDVLAPELIERFRRDVRPHLDQQEPGGGVFYGKRTKRLGNLFRLTDTTAEIVADPTILAVVGSVLSPHCINFRLSLTAVIENWGGGDPQPLHRDGDIYHPFLKNDCGEVLVSVMVAGSDFTKANGGTRVIPGSHKWKSAKEGSEADAVQVEMTAGSVAFWTGATVHGLAVNTTDQPRMGIPFGYTVGWLRQEEEMFLAVPPEKARTMSKELQRLIGYRSHGPFLGWNAGNITATFDGFNGDMAELSADLLR